VVEARRIDDAEAWKGLGANLFGYGARETFRDSALAHMAQVGNDVFDFAADSDETAQAIGTYPDAAI
jgi:hypothetical protein